MVEENNTKKNWAEEEDDEGDEQTIGKQTEVTASAEEAEAVAEAPKKVYPAPPTMQRN